MRAVIEHVFGVGRRRAIEILHQFGGYQTGKTFLVDRASLLRQLEALEAGAGFARERSRRRGLSEDLAQAQSTLKGRRVPITAPQDIGGLPNGTQLRPGELRIAFRDTEDLLRQLLEFAMAIHDDYQRFDEMCSG